MKKLKGEVLKDLQKNKSCTQTCFKILENSDDVSKMQAIMAPDSTFKNTDRNSRGYFLGRILKHIGDEIWSKVD